MIWPTYSPEMSPTTHTFYLLESHIRMVYRASTNTGWLMIAIITACLNKSQKVLAQLKEWMPREFTVEMFENERFYLHHVFGTAGLLSSCFWHVRVTYIKN